jgi:hypothetical protein
VEPDNRSANISHDQSVGGEESSDKICGVAGVTAVPPKSC